MAQIVQKDDPVLRKKAQDVSATEFGSKKLDKIISEMKQSLDGEKDGVAIAAPQIGVSKRIFVVSGKILPEEKDQKIFINPEISNISRDKKKMEEGCLSVRWFYGKTRRASRITIKASNEKGGISTKKATGFLAQIFQHEIDHLNGILFIDHAKNIKEIRPENEES